MKILLNCLDLIFALILLGPIFTKNKMIAPMIHSASHLFNQGAERVEHSTIKNGIYYLSSIAGKICIACFALMILFFYILPKPNAEFSLFLTLLFIASFYIWFAVNWIFNHKVLLLGHRIKDRTHLIPLAIGIGLMLLFPEISIFKILAEMFNQTLSLMGYELISASNSMLNFIGLMIFLICLIFIYCSFWVISLIILSAIAAFVLVSILSFKFFSKYIVQNEDTEQKFLTFVLVAYLFTQLLLRFAYG